MNDKLSVSAMFRCRRFSDIEIGKYCETLAGCGTRHLVLDAETLAEVLEAPRRLDHYRRLIGGFGLDFRDAHSTWGDWPEGREFGPGNDLAEMTGQSAAKAETAIKMLGDAGVSTVTFHIGSRCCFDHTWYGNEEKYRAAAARDLERLLPAAERSHVVLAVENLQCGPSCDAFEAMRLVKRFPSPWLGLCFDTGHANLLEPKPGREVRKMAGYILEAWRPGEPDFTPGIAEFMAPEIVTVHIHDNDALDDRHAPPGGFGADGIDWNRLAGVLGRAPRLISLQSEVDNTEERMPILGEIQTRVLEFGRECAEAADSGTRRNGENF